MFGFGESALSSNSSILGEMTISLDTGAMVTSSGALENRESVSTAVSQAVKLMGLYHHQPRSTTAAAEGTEDEAISGQTYKKVSFVYSDRAYVVIRSGNKLMVTLKRIEERPQIDQLMTHGGDSADDSDISDPVQS